MAIQLPMTVFGFGELYNEVFNAVASLATHPDYHALLMLTLMVGGVFAVVRYITTRSMMQLAIPFISYVVVMAVLLAPLGSVFITDEINQNQFYEVDHVPLGMAVPASLLSRIGVGLTQLMEEFFSLPDDVHYSQTGMVMMSSLVENQSQFAITDPDVAKSLNSFMNQCVFYDLLLHRYSLQTLMSTPDVMNFLKENASKARAFELTQNGASAIVTCSDGIQTLANDFSAEGGVLSAIAQRYGVRLYPESSNPAATLLSHLQSAWQYLGQVSQDGNALLTQSVMVNAFNEAWLSNGMMTNSPASVEAYTFAKSNSQLRLSSETLARMAGYWLPLLNATLTVVLYGMFILVVPLVLTPLGLPLFQSWLMTLLWLQLWAPLYAVVNLCVTFYGQHAASPLVQSVGGLTLGNQAPLTQIQADMVDVAGYLSILVPFLAGGLLFGLTKTFESLSHYFGGLVQSQAGQAVSEAVGGNISSGNFNYSNHTMMNDSAFHIDEAARAQAGGLTTQLPGGSMLSLMPDGTPVMNNQPALSNLGTSVNLADSVRASYLKQADASETAGLTHAENYSQGLAGAARNVTDFSYQVGRSAQGSDNEGVGLSGDVRHSLNQVHQLTDQFAHNHQVSFDEAASVLSRAYAQGSASASLGGKVGVGGSLGVGIGGERSASNTDSHSQQALYQEALNYTHTSGYGEDMSQVMNAFQNHQVQTSGDESSRFASHLGNTLEHLENERSEATASFQKADSYRQMASLAEEESVTINSQGNQVFFEWLAEQPNPNGGGTLGARGAETMMTQHPEVAEQYAKTFSAHYSEHLATDWAHHLPETGSAVEGMYGDMSKTLPSGDDIEDHQAAAQNRFKEEQSALAHQDALRFRETARENEVSQQETARQISAGEAPLQGKAEALQKEVLKPQNLTRKSVVKELWSGVKRDPNDKKGSSS